MNDLIPFADIERMAQVMGKNGMFGKKPDELLPLMLIAQAEGNHPALAAIEYDIIQGRPALKGQAALARFQQAGGRIEWLVRSDVEAKARFWHQQGGELIVSWTIDRARKMKLDTKDNWQKQPVVMLSWRCVAEGVRAVFPACLNRMYLVEEVQDFDSKPPAPEMKPAPEPVTVVPEPDHDYRVECSKLSDELGLLTSEKKKLYDEAGHDYAVLARHLAQLRDSKHSDTASAAMAAAQRVRDFSNFPAMPTQPQPEPQTDGLFEEPQA